MRPTARRPWSRFLMLVSPVFRSEIRWQVIGLLGLLLALLLSVGGLNVLNSYVGRDFMTAISERQAGRYRVLSALYLGVFAATTIVSVCNRFVEERLGLLWRRWLTGNLLDRYLSGRAYFRLRASQEIDNPDQRITEDVKTFSVTTLSFSLMALNATITALAFSGVLWSIDPKLFLVAVAYAACGTLMSVLLGRRLVGLNNLQLKKEADLRYELIHVRENVDSVAILNGEREEGARLRRRLGEVVGNYRSIVGVNRNLGFFTTGYNYLIQVLPILIVAPLYIRGESEFGVITQAMMAFTHVVNAFSLIVTKFAEISSYAAVIARLGSIWEAIEEAPPSGPAAIEIVEDDTRVAFDHLTLRAPQDGHALVSDLTVEVPRGRRLLVVGPHGAGKSALFRATAGIWDGGEGRIVRPGRGLMILPQRPHLVQGPLRDQLLYAGENWGMTDRRLTIVLREVGLGPVLARVGGLDAEQDWANTLSMAEKQLLAFARLLLASPRFALLDDATSALDVDRAESLYRLLSWSQVSYISLAERPCLLTYHDAILELQGEGAWDLRPIHAAEALAG